MSVAPADTHGRAVEELCVAYRAIVSDPPLGSIDHELLTIAARLPAFERIRSGVYIAAALLIIAFGLTALLATVVPYGGRSIGPIAGMQKALRNWVGNRKDSAVPIPTKLSTFQVSTQSQQRQAISPSAQAVPRSGCPGSGTCSGTAVVPGPAGLRVSGFLLGPLKAAQAAQQAAMDARFAHDSPVESAQLQIEIRELLLAQTSKGQKTAFDEYLIDSWLGVAYVRTRDFAKAVPLLQAAALSPYATPAQRKGFLQAATSILNSLPPK